MFFTRRRINVYFKFCILIILVIFYFSFLFRQSLNAFDEVNKQQEKIVLSSESKSKRNIENFHRRAAAKLKKLHRPKIVTINAPNSILYSTTKSPSTLNPVYEYSEEIHTATEKDLLQRKAFMMDICNKRNLIGVYPPKPWEFFISQGHSLTWCNVFKAASSTWMYYFNILGGYNINYLQRTKMSPLELARKRFPRPHLDELLDSIQTSLTFLVVREPFERLLSAYRDKIEGCHKKFYKDLAKQIIRKFRKSNDFRFQKTGPTFKEFVLFLIKQFQLGKQFDEHWAPIFSFCTPCSVNFTLIAKVETFQRDTEFIIRQAGLEPLLLGKLPKNKMRKISNQSLHISGSLIEKYFSEIDRSTLDDLLQIYQLDFELFGYNSSKYYDIVQPPFVTYSSIANLSTMETLIDPSTTTTTTTTTTEPTSVMENNTKKYQ